MKFKIRKRLNFEMNCFHKEVQRSSGIKLTRWFWFRLMVVPSTRDGCRKFIPNAWKNKNKFCLFKERMIESERLVYLYKFVMHETREDYEKRWKSCEISRVTLFPFFPFIRSRSRFGTRRKGGKIRRRQTECRWGTLKSFRGDFFLLPRNTFAKRMNLRESFSPSREQEWKISMGDRARGRFQREREGTRLLSRHWVSRSRRLRASPSFLSLSLWFHALCLSNPRAMCKGVSIYKSIVCIGTIASC